MQRKKKKTSRFYGIIISTVEILNAVIVKMKILLSNIVNLFKHLCIEFTDLPFAQNRLSLSQVRPEEHKQL